MADEANFCLNCGENLARYRTNSGFVREPGPPDPGPSGEDPPSRAHGVEVEVTTTGESASRPSPLSRQVKAQLSKARLSADAGKLQEAAEQFQQATDLDPESSDAWYGLGVIFGRLGRHVEALAAFNRLVEVAPRLPAAWDAKGTALAALGRLGEAVGAFDEAIRLDTSLTSAWLEKGILLARTEDLKGALDCFDAVIEQEPSNLTAWVHRGDALVKLHDHRRAMQAYDHALEVDPGNPAGWRKKGALLLAMGHAPDARRCFDRALQLDANDFEALVRRGDAMRAAGDPNGAVDSYDRAAKLQAGRAEPHIRKGLLFFSLQQFPAARDCFARAKDLEPDAEVAAVNHAVALFRCRDWEAAKRAAQAALLRWPGQSELARVLSATERKLQAAHAGLAPARPVQPPGTDHTVEDIFLIYRDGRLIAHQTRRLRAEVDNQLLSGMLTAIQSFIKEAFREGEESELNEMAFGKNQILIERGRWVSLAVVIHGVTPVGARAELTFAVQNIEKRYGRQLEGWDGDAARLRGAGESIKRVLESL